jgi:hypothetical protein
VLAYLGSAGFEAAFFFVFVQLVVEGLQADAEFG